MRLFFSQTFTLKRLTNDSGSTTKEAYVAGTGFSGALMNARPEDAMLSEGNPAKTAVLFCDVSTDIRDTDKVTCSGVDYIVRGVSTTVGVGFSLSFKKAVLEKLNS